MPRGPARKRQAVLQAHGLAAPHEPGEVPKKVLEFRLNYEYPTNRYIGARLGYTADAVLYTANVRVGKGNSYTDYYFRMVDGTFTLKSTVEGEIPCVYI